MVTGTRVISDSFEIEKMQSQDRSTGVCMTPQTIYWTPSKKCRVTWVQGNRFGSYGVWPCSAQTLEDQLGLVPGTKSKIEDGSDMGTSSPEVMTVADFWKRLRFGP